MPYFDVSGTIDLAGARPAESLPAAVYQALQSIGGDPTLTSPASIVFRIPLGGTVTRGFPLQGVSHGELRFPPAEGHAPVLQYRLATIPMRWFALVFTATVAFTPLVVGVVQEDEPIQLLGYCARIPLVLVFGGLLYLAGTVIVRAKFQSFISKTFGGGKLTTR